MARVTGPMGLLLGGVLAVVGAVHAQTQLDGNLGVNAVAPPQPTDGAAAVPAYAEYDKKVRAAEQVAPLASDLFGDTVSPYLGQASTRWISTCRATAPCRCSCGVVSWCRR